MTTSSISASVGRPRRQLAELALGLALFLLVAGLWLAFFYVVPLDVRPPRVS